MSILPNLLRSLLITSVFSFAAPIILIGTTLVGVSLLGYIPVLEAIAQSASEQIIQVLATFGSDRAWEGLVVIGLVCSLVGVLFDTYTFYRHQNLRNP